MTLEAERAQASPPPHFGLALSGGGFRATLFHLGIIRFLSESSLLPRVKFVSGVSGGAILAAHLGLNWEKYTGDYRTAAEPLVALAQRDVRNRVLRRWFLATALILPRILGATSRGELLEREYRRIFDDRKLNELPRVHEGHGPRIVLQGVSLTTGLPCGFGTSGYLRYEESDDEQGRGTSLTPESEFTVPGRDMTVAKAVAASSAFPPLFPPVQITYRDERRPDRPTMSDFVTDGGVFDNLGIDRPLWWYRDPPERELYPLKSFLISDAEGAFDRDVEGVKRFQFVVARNIRATEVMMKRMSTLTWKWLGELVGLKFVAVNISRHPSANGELRGIVEDIRTDLDRFSDLEVDALVWSGREAAREVLEKAGWVPTGRFATGETIPEVAIGKLRKSQKRSWIPLLFDPRDPLCWWLLAAVVFGGLTLVIL